MLTLQPMLTISPDDPVGGTTRKLIHDLCAEVGARYGRPPSPFSLSEAATERTIFLIARLDKVPIGCGAIRRIDEDTAEVKRMYVAPAGRRRGIARRILAELERSAVDFGYRAIRLETGILQPEAQRLYESCGYKRITAFGHYVGNPTSVCYEKVLHDRNRAA
jgi:GNAT superfamily N-acetyltransferase